MLRPCLLPLLPIAVPHSCADSLVLVGCLHSSFALWQKPWHEESVHRLDFEEEDYRHHQARPKVEDSVWKSNFAIAFPPAGE